MEDSKPLRERPIGDSQRYVLTRLVRGTGMWHRRSGWRWSTDYWTIQILENLALSGWVEAVQEEGKQDAYRLTTEGQRRAVKMLKDPLQH